MFPTMRSRLQERSATVDMACDTIIAAAREIARIEQYGGNWIRQYRLARNLSQRALAQRIGMTYVNLCNVESGKAKPFGTMQRILDYEDNSPTH